MLTGSGKINMTSLQGSYKNLTTVYAVAKELSESVHDIDIVIPFFNHSQIWLTGHSRGFHEWLTSRLQGSKRIDDSLRVRITRIYRAEEYKAACLNYKRLAKFIQGEISSDKMMANYFGESLNRTQFEIKYTLTNKLIELSTQLYKQYSPDLEVEHRQVESELLSKLTPLEYNELLFINSSIHLLDVIKSLMTELRYEIVLILKKLHSNRKRDVRTKLREIVRSHFKYMDDDSDSDQFFILNMKQLITSKIIHHGYERNYTAA